MKARSISLHDLGENWIQKLKVPFFQRNYVWTEENWEELFQGFTSGNTPPFLGSIILKDDSDSDDESIKEMQIVDGQQRLTTISIFAKAIFDSLPDETKQDYDCGIRNDVRSIYFIRKMRQIIFETAT